MVTVNPLANRNSCGHGRIPGDILAALDPWIAEVILFLPSRDRLLLLDRFTDRSFLACVCLLNIVLRLPLLFLDVLPTSDDAWYFDTAKAIATGRGFAEADGLTAFWPVGWPAFLGALLRVFGPHVLVGQCTNLLLSTAAIVLVASIGKRLFVESPAWRLAAVLLAIYPNNIASVALLSVENFFEFLLLLGFLLLMSRSAIGFIVSGLVFGVASLTKTQAVLLPGVLALPLLMSLPFWASFKRWLRTTLLVGVAMLTVILPWSVRNYTVFHAVVPIAANGGVNLLRGNNPSAAGGYTMADPLFDDLPTGAANQVAIDRMAQERGARWIRQNPGKFLALIPAKIAGLWAGDGETEWLYQMGYSGYGEHVRLFRALRIANQLFYFALLAGALMSLRPLIRQRWLLPAWCFSGWAVFGYFTLISMVFFGQSRFHFALMPFVILYAAWAACRPAVPQRSFAGLGRPAAV